jgi:nucleoid DNA-binding protein
MTKADIARIVYERHGGLSNREAANLVALIFDTIKGQLAARQKVRGRNPQTGEEMRIKPRWSVGFKPSKLFGASSRPA